MSGIFYICSMIDLSHAEGHIHCVTNFKDLVATPFSGVVNAIGWTRNLAGDFGEIVEKIELSGNMTTIEQEELRELPLSEQGQLARAVLLADWQLLEDHGAAPVLNVIRYYEQDNAYPFFPTDVYSWHVDRSPIPTDTFLCTYYGDASEVLPNAQGTQKILIPEIRDALKKQYDGPAEGFEAFLSEYFFDLHYQAAPGAYPVDLGIGHLWRLAIDHPGQTVPPSLHRAPRERSGRPRLLMIC